MGGEDTTATPTQLAGSSLPTPGQPPHHHPPRGSATALALLRHVLRDRPVALHPAYLAYGSRTQWSEFCEGVLGCGFSLLRVRSCGPRPLTAAEVVDVALLQPAPGLDQEALQLGLQSLQVQDFDSPDLEAVLLHLKLLQPPRSPSVGALDQVGEAGGSLCPYDCSSDDGVRGGPLTSLVTVLGMLWGRELGRYSHLRPATASPGGDGRSAVLVGSGSGSVSEPASPLLPGGTAPSALSHLPSTFLHLLRTAAWLPTMGGHTCTASEVVARTSACLAVLGPAASYLAADLAACRMLLAALGVRVGPSVGMVLAQLRSWAQAGGAGGGLQQQKQQQQPSLADLASCYAFLSRMAVAHTPTSEAVAQTSTSDCDAGLAHEWSMVASAFSSEALVGLPLPGSHAGLRFFRPSEVVWADPSGVVCGGGLPGLSPPALSTYYPAELRAFFETLGGVGVGRGAGAGGRILSVTVPLYCSCCRVMACCTLVLLVVSAC